VKKLGESPLRIQGNPLTGEDVRGGFPKRQARLTNKEENVDSCIRAVEMIELPQ